MALICFLERGMRRAADNKYNAPNVIQKLERVCSFTACAESAESAGKSFNNVDLLLPASRTKKKPYVDLLVQ